MFHAISHIDLQVVDLNKAKNLWANVIGLSITAEGDGFIELDSGNITIRLIEVPLIEQTTTLRLSVPSVQNAYTKLTSYGAQVKYAPMNTPDLQKIACVTDENGHSIIIWRSLSEDEWDFVPELPKTGEWYDDAEQLLLNLLSHVPAFFRMLARRKVTRVVEELAREDNSPVTREHVIKGYITSSAKVTRSRLIEPLKAEGINPDDYQAEFNYE
jgi:predicted enzyme related to lactoylglutathione lyase